MVIAHRIFTHSGTFEARRVQKLNTAGRCSNLPALVPVKRASVMMPMVFCASLVPWTRAM